MKYLVVGLLMILWMIATVALVITFIGIIVLVDEDIEWGKLPQRLLSWK